LLPTTTSPTGVTVQRTVDELLAALPDQLGDLLDVRFVGIDPEFCVLPH